MTGQRSWRHQRDERATEGFRRKAFRPGNGPVLDPAWGIRPGPPPGGCRASRTNPRANALPHAGNPRTTRRKPAADRRPPNWAPESLKPAGGLLVTRELPRCAQRPEGLDRLESLDSRHVL